MHDRIGTLHLDHRVPRGGTSGATFVPTIDRAVRAGLADALSRRMDMLTGDDPGVVVVRELHTSVKLSASAAMFDGQVVEHVSRCAAEALADLLASDVSTDEVMRFPDQAAFVGTFIVALIEGTAWERWYFGAFGHHRHADTAAALRSVLDECGAGAARVLGWLSQRGHLEAVLALVSPHEARRLCGGTTGTSAQDTDGLHALIDAARRLLQAIDPGLVEPSWFDARVAHFLEAAPVPVAWADTRGPSVRVAELVRWVAGDGARVDASRGPAVAQALRALLAGPLDWLDTRWLAAELIDDREALGPPEPRLANPRRHVLTPRQDRLLERVTTALRERRVRMPAGANVDEIVVRLVAAAALDATGPDEAPDRSIVSVIEHAVRAAVALRAAPAEARRAALDEAWRLIAKAAQATGLGPAGSASVAALRNAGPAALQVLRHLAEVMAPAAASSTAPGVATNAAGIFLLARAIDDTRLPALARRSGLEEAPLLGALAARWTGAAIEPQEVFALWTGHGETGALDAAALRSLNDALAALLIERGALQSDTLETDPADPLALTSRLLLRGWARWLPGLNDASEAFLLDRCVRRAGRLHIEDDRVLVRLAPAPLDVVLKMAGYLARVDGVRWLGDRALVFEIDDGAAAT